MLLTTFLFWANLNRNPLIANRRKLTISRQRNFGILEQQVVFFVVEEAFYPFVLRLLFDFDQVREYLFNLDFIRFGLMFNLVVKMQLLGHCFVW